MEEQKTALVTGADRGLGLSITKGLLKEGWRVFAGKYLADYGLLEDLAAKEGSLVILPLDVSDPESIRANFYKCGDKTAHPHYLSWSPIDTPKPDFHRPEFFGELILK